MKTSKKGIELIKKHEGLRLEAYQCAANKWTIGYGHVILSGENLKIITKQQAEELLMKDLSIAEKCVNENVKVEISQNQFDALVSFVFNVGCGAFKSSTMLKALNNGK